MLWPPCAAAGGHRAHPCRVFAPLQRDGCPKIVNLGSAKTDLFYERKKCACATLRLERARVPFASPLHSLFLTPALLCSTVGFKKR